MQRENYRYDIATKTKKYGRRRNDANCVGSPVDSKDNYIFSVRDRRSPNGVIITLNMRGINLPNVIIDSGACRNFMERNT